MTNQNNQFEKFGEAIRSQAKKKNISLQEEIRFVIEDYTGSTFEGGFLFSEDITSLTDIELGERVTKMMNWTSALSDKR